MDASLNAVEFGESPAVVFRTGKLFEIGEYPDKEFSLSDAEAEECVAAFAPVEGDSEHKPSVFDGKLGRLTEIWKDGSAIFGRAEIPRPINELFASEPIPISLSFDKATKRITKFAYAKNPRITDAALEAAFSKQGADTHEEPFMTKDEIKDAFAEAFAPVRELFSSFSKKEEETPKPTGDDPQKTEMEKEIARLRAERLELQAVAFARSQVEAGKLPADPETAEFKACVLEATRALADDQSDKAAGVHFSDDSPARFAMLEARYKAMAPIADPKKLGEELTGAQTTFSQEQSEVSKERIKELMAYTPLGQTHKE